jgi:Zn-dependent peptidase ImmA (M78 family)
VANIHRQFNIIDPPVDPVAIARNLGVKVHFVAFKKVGTGISGFYDADDNAIYVNSDEFPLRQTFTVAHELGHKILHEDWAKSTSYKMLLRNAGEQSTDPYEREANAFAAHLLVPRFMLDLYWRKNTLEDLSRLFAVSVPVIQNRIAFEYGA